MRLKSILRHSMLAILVMAGVLASGVDAFAQDKRVITGQVLDQSSYPVIGAAVVVEGTTSGTVTDIDGNYKLEVSADAQNLQVSFLGYFTEIVPITGNVVNVQLTEEMTELSDIVVIGYGTTKKGDLTGSVANVTAEDFNVGLINSAEQLINGKVSGVQIMSASGSPTAGSSIKIRGGASLNASNDPLIVLDGVPLENGGISGNSGNFLSLINPADIESMTVLKDASSTAIYGSRASNGVIIITTKKGASDKLRVSLNTTHSMQVKTELADMLSRDEFVDVINKYGTTEQKSLLGTADTDWNDEIFRLAYGTDNNVSLSGGIAGVPVRVSLGYYNQNGILDTDNAQRYSGNVSVAPSLFEDHLKVNLGVKLSMNKNRFATSSAIWNAAVLNPTMDIYKDYGAGNPQFGGYNEAVNAEFVPVTGAVSNAVGLLQQREDESEVKRLVGNFDVDYKLHVLPELKFHLTLGYDYAEGKGTVKVGKDAYETYTSNGRDYEYGPQEMSNKLLTAYINYNKVFDICSVDFTAGYDYQFWKSATPKYDIYDALGATIESVAASDQRHALLSYYGRLNYTMLDRYMVTATVRRDGTSRFSKDERWGTFPSVALAWRLSEEGFLADMEWLSNFKLRASYGITGQQEGIGNYNYQPVYTISQTGANYYFGDKLINTYRPEAYVSDLKWETTKAWNYGVDFGFFNNRLNGSFEFYDRTTEDLLASVPCAGGTNFDKYILTNVGNVDSKGWELNINGTPIDNDDWTLDLSFNASWQTSKITNLSLVDNAEVTNTLVGPAVDGQQVQVFTEGYQPYMFYVYHQLYDKSGKPIEGAYADLNGDGVINTSDLYRYNSPAPDYMMGFSLNLRYKRVSLGTSLRANIGGYVYNGMAMNTGAWGTVSYNNYQLNNLNRSFLETGFKSRQHLSDYYVENASFLKMDNISLAYDFGRINDMFNLNASFMVQNVFTITEYTGVDPEIPNGVDVSFYPRPRVFSFSLGLEF